MSCDAGNTSTGGLNKWSRRDMGAGIVMVRRRGINKLTKRARLRAVKKPHPTCVSLVGIRSGP
jgi:hypothetical protein